MAMTESADWDALRAMRMAGQKPALAVIVTSKIQLPKRLEGVGCMVILHRAGEVMPIDLLEGLDVLFFFDKCELVGHVWRLAKAKEVTFARCRAWCTCASMPTILPMACDSYAAAIEWLEGPNAA
jgi:hypothetical protein